MFISRFAFLGVFAAVAAWSSDSFAYQAEYSGRTASGRATCSVVVSETDPVEGVEVRVSSGRKSFLTVLPPELRGLLRDGTGYPNQRGNLNMIVLMNNLTYWVAASTPSFWYDHDLYSFASQYRQGEILQVLVRQKTFAIASVVVVDSDSGKPLLTCDFDPPA
jgi:hypothetical protein